MATTTVNFKQDGKDYISDAIAAKSNNLAFRIKVDKTGDIILERSITGDSIPLLELLFTPQGYIFISYPVDS